MNQSFFNTIIYFIIFRILIWLVNNIIKNELIDILIIIYFIYFFVLVDFQNRLVNGVIIFVTIILVVSTLISALVSGSRALDLFFVVCIILFCISHLTLVIILFPFDREKWYMIGVIELCRKIFGYISLLLLMWILCSNSWLDI